MSLDNQVLWKRFFGGTGFDGPRSISTTQNDEYLIGGYSGSSNVDLNNNYGQNDAWVLKIDTNGNLLFQKSIGGTGEDIGNDVVELVGGKIVFVGETNSNDNDFLENKGFTDIFVVKMR